MEKSDIEFWNGVSNGVVLSIDRLEKIAENCKDADDKTICKCIEALREESQKVAKLHVKEVRSYLRANVG